MMAMPSFHEPPTTEDVRPAPWGHRAPRPRLVGRTVVPVAEAVATLVGRGYVRTVECCGETLWCPSCDVSFDPAVLLVGAVIAADGATVLGLRDPDTGVGTVWVVQEWTAIERRVLGRLQWSSTGRRRRPPQRARRAAQFVR